MPSTLLAGLKRGYPLVVCALVGAGAYFQARGLGHLLSGELSEAVPAPAARRARSFAREPLPDADPILERNPFDSRTGPLDGSAPPPPEIVPPPPPADPLAAPKCDFGQVTLIVASDPSFSFAAITEKKTRESRLYRVGDAVDGRRVARIGWDRVWLEGSEARCQMELGEKVIQPRRKARTPPHKRTRRRSRNTLPDDIARKIHRVSDTEYTIDRSAVDAILENQAQLMRRTRIRPEKRGDEVIGVRMSRVRGGTLLHAIGIRTGDVVKSIHGFPIADPQKALQAYARLRTADSLHVELERGGKPVTMKYKIQ